MQSLSALALGSLCVQSNHQCQEFQEKIATKSNDANNSTAPGLTKVSNGPLHTKVTFTEVKYIASGSRRLLFQGSLPISFHDCQTCQTCSTVSEFASLFPQFQGIHSLQTSWVNRVRLGLFYDIKIITLSLTFHITRQLSAKKYL